MWIQSSISYWKDGVLNYNPEKIIIRLREFFPQLVTDWKDQSRQGIERFFQIMKEKNLKPPTFIIDKKWELFATNSPTFLFRISTKSNIEITGTMNRWRIEFKSEQLIDTLSEKNIVDFLKSIEYGEIRSDKQTEHFCIPDENFKNNWTLKR